MWNLCGPGPLPTDFDVIILFRMMAERLIDLKDEYKVCPAQLFCIPSGDMKGWPDEERAIEILVKWAVNLEEMILDRWDDFLHPLVAWEKSTGITLISGQWAELEPIERKTGFKKDVSGNVLGNLTRCSEVERRTGIRSDAGAWTRDWQTYLLMAKRA